MNSFKIPILFLVGLLALGIIMVGGCAKKAQAPNENVAAETFITSYHVDIAPDSATYYFVTVYWKYSDKDGEALEYRYWTNVDTAKVRTFDATARIRLNFPDVNTVDTFYIEARDNRGIYDATPAFTPMSPADDRNISEYKPNTEVVNFTNGILTSAGIHVTFTGSDFDGAVLSFQYMLDTDSVWTTVANDLIANAVVVDILGIQLGARTLTVRSIDNFGFTDPSPAEVSFVVVNTLRPDLSVTAGAIPNAFYFLPQGGSATSVATTWFGDATWYYSTLTYHYAVDDTTTWSPWQDSATTVLPGLIAGAHKFFVEAKDLAGNITLFSTDFGVGQLAGDRGILVVNGIDWATGIYITPAQEMYTAHAPWGDHVAHYWELITGHSSLYPAVLDSIIVGNGVIPGDSLGRYSSVVMVLNGLGGDLEAFQSMLPLIMSYLNAGGNVVMITRNGEQFVVGDLQEYAHASFNATGVSLTSVGLTAAVSGLVAMTYNGDPGGGLSSSSLLAIPTNPDVTTLFTSSNRPNSVSGIIVEPSNKGKFVYIAVRPYRLTVGTMKANFDYILTHYFGETQ